MKKIIKLVKNEDGQALILVTLLMVVLLGFAALVVDLGTLYVTKAKLQNAADAAALAGAQDLPTASTAENTAITYAGKNGVKSSSGDTVTTTAPYNSDSTKIEVVCTRTVKNYFVGVLGPKFATTDVSARAVAQKSQMAIGALPFINMGDQYLKADGTYNTGVEISLWTKEAPGDKERIHDSILSEPNDHTIIVDYSNGIRFQKGRDVRNEIKTPLINITTVGNTVYLFSLRNDAIINKDYDGFDEKAYIPLNKLVLLKCKMTDSWSGPSDQLISVSFQECYPYDAATGGFKSAINGEIIGGRAPKLVE